MSCGNQFIVRRRVYSVYAWVFGGWTANSYMNLFCSKALQFTDNFWHCCASYYGVIYYDNCFTAYFASSESKFLRDFDVSHCLICSNKRTSNIVTSSNDRKIFTRMSIFSIPHGHKVRGIGYWSNNVSSRYRKKFL